jgi:hypothetical protein
MFIYRLYDTCILNVNCIKYKLKFVAIDKYLIICGVLNDDEILNKADDEDPPVSSNEAKLDLRVILSFL